MGLLLTILYSLPFVLSAHFCASAAIACKKSSARNSYASLSASNAKLLRNLLWCLTAINTTIFVVYMIGWALGWDFVFYKEAFPWLFSAIGWCLVWHSHKLESKFNFEIDSSKPSYKVPVSSRAPDATPVNIRGSGTLPDAPNQPPLRNGTSG